MASFFYILDIFGKKIFICWVEEIHINYFSGVPGKWAD